MTQPRRLRVHAALTVLAFVAYAVGCCLFWVEPLWRQEWDSALYLITGRNLAEGAGYTYLSEPFILRPPGFAWMISWLWTDQGFDALRFNRLVMTFAATFAPAVYLAMASRGRWRALALALLVCTNPVTVANFNRIMSDFPFLTFLFLGIAAVERAGRRSPRAWWWAAAAVIGLTVAIYLRTVGALLIPGILLLALPRRDDVHRPRLLIVGGLLIVLASPWILHAAAMAPRVSVPARQMLNYSYTTSMFHQKSNDPSSDLVSFSGWMGRVRRNGDALMRDVAFAIVGNDHLGWAVGISAVVVAGWCLRSWRGFGILEWFTISYILVLLTYFTNSFRLAMPLVPLLYLYVLLIVDRIFGRLGAGPRMAHVAVGAAVAALLALNLYHFPAAREGRVPAGTGGRVSALWQQGPALRRNMDNVTQWIETATEPDDVLLCCLAPTHAVRTGRECHTFCFTPPQEVSNLLEQVKPRYVIFDIESDRTRALEPLVRKRSIRRHWITDAHDPRTRIVVHELPPWPDR